MSEELDLRTEAGLARARELMPHLFPAETVASGRAYAAQAITRPTLGNRYCLDLPFHTARLNELMSGIKQKMRLRRRDDGMVESMARLSGIPEATGPRFVALLVMLRPGQRAGDPDGWWKSLLDSLVRCRMLVDDSAKHCALGSVEFARGPRAAMFVTLEDLPR